MNSQDYRSAFRLPAGPVHRNRRIKRRMSRPLCWALSLAVCTAEACVLVAYIACLPKPEAVASGIYRPPQVLPSPEPVQGIAKEPSAAAPSFP